MSWNWNLFVLNLSKNINILTETSIFFHSRKIFTRLNRYKNENVYFSQKSFYKEIVATIDTLIIPHFVFIISCLQKINKIKIPKNIIAQKNGFIFISETKITVESEWKIISAMKLNSSYFTVHWPGFSVGEFQILFGVLGNFVPEFWRVFVDSFLEHFGIDFSGTWGIFKNIHSNRNQISRKKEFPYFNKNYIKFD